MKHVRLTAFVMLLSVACSGDQPDGTEELATRTTPAAESPRYETTEVGDGVYQFRFVGHNTLFVVTDAGIVAFDPISIEAAAAYAEEMKRHAPGIDLAAIVYSHRDADHATGANVLREAFGRDVPIYGHVNSLAPLVEAADPNLPPPDQTFSERLELADGAVELHYLGRSHSDDMAVGFLPRYGIAFAVDFVASDRFGYQDLSSFHFPDMHDAIAGLLELPFETIVFGHGPSGDRATIERQREYYLELDRRVREAVEAGLSEDETAATVVLDEYRHWGRYEDWREMNVRGMYRKISGTAD